MKTGWAQDQVGEYHYFADGTKSLCGACLGPRSVPREMLAEEIETMWLMGDDFCVDCQTGVCK